MERFKTHSKGGRPDRRRRLALSWWSVWRLPVLLTIISAAWWYGYRPIAKEQSMVSASLQLVECGERWNGADGCIVDGDTIVIGNGPERRRVRLTGFDAPELDGACTTEQNLARQARAALNEWIARGPFEWTGGAEPPRDRFGRELREARRADADGSEQYLADYLLQRGLAAEGGWGADPVDWCG